MNSPDARCAAVSSPGTRNAPRPTLRPLAVAKPALFAACCVPFATLALRAFEVGGLGLGPNPIEALIHGFGEWGLRLLLATLAVSPLRAASGAGWVLGLRRMLGLFAFGYLALHFLTWLVFDRWLDAASIVADIAKRPYITVGFVGLTLLVPLAVTSTAGWMRRLGRRWVQLHRLIYPAAVLGCIHFWWQVKADIREPLLYAVILALLLGWRLQRARARAAARVPARSTG